ncbi:hypothetical protein [Goodfellowiella coeruleoviolacea]|uniref:Secreted protein n=1 Tax=Goodfellowiella coeruleoviolacea TaxID=334858 RepID=A0AAE3KIC6_9PSEU|nr:hypothetical protein [Goodfellowiella coeruleoviolacea]MCP2169131.1 hypothetical protein [Goodfellowiella coeruleoviolacea]
MSRGTRAKILAGGALVLGLLIGGCGAQQGQSTGGATGASGQPTSGSATTQAAVMHSQPAQTPSCTDQMDYSGDPRSNAEINSIGAETGTCPPVQKSTQAKAPQGTGVSCTDQMDYSGDPRSNAEINSIGEQTGSCPSVEKSTPVPDSPSTVPCTDQYDYAGDPRSNAEINSIGQETGACPMPQN